MRSRALSRRPGLRARLPLAALLSALGFAACVRGPASEAAPPSEAELRVKRLEPQPGVVVRRFCTPSGPETCFDASDDNCNGIIDEGCGVRTGLVQFAIAWDEATADVDLNVTDPNGELVEAGRVVESGLVKERDCPGRAAECHGQNLENVFLETDSEVTRGAYRVRIRLEKIGREEPPIVVTLGARVGPKTYAAEIQLDRPEEEREVVFVL